MKKITFLIAMICIAAVSTAQSVATNWTFTNGGGNPPMTPGATPLNICPTDGVGTSRNMAAGVFNGNDRVFLFTRVGGPIQVYAYETAGGTLAETLNTTGIADGLVTIGDGDVTEDGKLLMCNVVDGSASPKNKFKVYQWDNSVDAPKVVIQWTVPYGTNGKDRFGDKAIIVGNITTGTAKVYTVNKKLGYGSVMCWSMVADTENPGTFKFNNEPTAVMEVFGNSTQPTITVTSDGRYYYKDKSKNLSNYDVAGDSLSQAPTSIIRSSSLPVKFICKDGNDDIIGLFNHRQDATVDGADPAQELVQIIRVPNGDLTNLSIIASTPSLGSNYNLNGWGDFVARKVGDNLEVFAFSTTNGFGKFTINNFLMTSSYKAAESSFELLPEAGQLFVKGATVSSIEVYNSVGQMVISNTNSNAISSEGLKGLHIIKVIAEDNQTKTFKMVL
jgi:hypothetical protein